MIDVAWWHEDHLDLLDQTRLPFEEVVLHCRTVGQVAEAIRALRVRGAPAIGVAAAFGLALSALVAPADPADFAARLAEDFSTLAATRPTAVNLFWALERCRRAGAPYASSDPRRCTEALLAEARAIAVENAEACRRMGEIGAACISDGMSLLTHCNAGALATAGLGTATAPIYVAHARGCRVSVYVDETRPLLQGARLTAWELDRVGIPFTLITDSMAAYLMQLGRVDAVFVGADRIAANGDVANKIGTYALSLAAHAHGLPFYVVAPLSTVDPATPTGAAIPIEERNPEEVRGAWHTRWVPDAYPVFNPAFDVTPAPYITAIITERGLAVPPFGPILQRFLAPGQPDGDG